MRVFVRHKRLVKEDGPVWSWPRNLAWTASAQWRNILHSLHFGSLAFEAMPTISAGAGGSKRAVGPRGSRSSGLMSSHPRHETPPFRQGQPPTAGVSSAEDD